MPNVPGAFLLSDVLSLEECRGIIARAEAVGFGGDKPVVTKNAAAGESILAHVCLYLVPG